MRRQDEDVHPTYTIGSMRVGKYETEAFLGGGMSEVYRAKDTVLGRTVALKILTAASSADPPTKERFLLEARLCRGISHDHIVTTYDYGEEDGRPYMVMEFLVGQTLRQAIAAKSLPDIPGRIRIALQVRGRWNASTSWTSCTVT